MAAPLTESYALKQIQFQVAGALTAFIHEMGGYVAWLDSSWEKRQAKRILVDSLWRTQSDWPPPFTIFTKDRNNSQINFSHHDHRHNEFISFANPRYGDGGDLWEGPERKVKEFEVNIDGLSKVFTNYTSNPIHIAYEEEVTLEHSDESHFDSEWALDVTSTTSQEVGGSYLGVEAKATFEQSVGVHTGGSSGGGSEDTAGRSDTVAIDSELPAGAVYHLEVFKHQLRTRQDYSINAAFDFDFRMKWCHWQHEKQLMKFRGGDEEIIVIGVAGLAALIAGQDTNHPSFEGYNPSHRVRNGLAWIMDPKNRWIDFSGVRERVFENNVDYKLTELHEDAIPPGIEVVDMSEEENQVKYGK